VAEAAPSGLPEDRVPALASRTLAGWRRLRLLDPGLWSRLALLVSRRLKGSTRHLYFSLLQRVPD
jgi:hypothetical protein